MLIPHHYPLDQREKRKNEVESIKIWLEECTNQHQSFGCSNPRSGSFPKRLVELLPKSSESRVVDVGSLSPVPEFVALSYCWGSTGNLKATKTTLPDMQQRIQSESLPATIMEAFELARNLGFRYIWVDALCIVQDDQEEWRSEAQKMGLVYSDAILVIAAMSSAGTEDGLYSRVAENTLDDERFHTVMQACRSRPRVEWEGFIHDNIPLLCRGWAFQERLLARRIVHFTAVELVWECKGHVRCQCGKIAGQDRRINNMNAAFQLCIDQPTPDRLRAMWRECVKTYTRRSLTRPDDREIAIAGIAQLLRPAEYPDLYISGLWKDALPYDLLWRCDQSTPLTTHRVRKPSWSWISIDSGINWPTKVDSASKSRLNFIMDDAYFEHGIQAIDCVYYYSPQHDQGSKKANPHVRLKAWVTEVRVGKQYFEAKTSPLRTEWYVEGKSGRRLPFYPDVSLSKHGEIREKEPFYFLEVVCAVSNASKYQIGLIIQKHADFGIQETYARIGIAGDMSFSHQNSALSWISEKNLDKRDVVLV